MQGDPYWLAARFAGTCARCRGPIKRGERIFYYPHTKNVYCGDEECGGAASADFQAHAADEAAACY